MAGYLEPEAIMTSRQIQKLVLHRQDMSLTTLVVTSRRSRLFTVTVYGLPLDDLLIGVDDPGEVVAGLQDVA